jgi:hypothetical protein
MWILVGLAAVLGLGYYVATHTPAAQAAAAAAQTSQGLLPPGSPTLVKLQSSDSTSFTTITLASGKTVAQFLPTTRDAMVAALAQNGWTVQELLTDPAGVVNATANFTIGPSVVSVSDRNPNALATLRAAALAGLNVFADADFALKLAGSNAAPNVMGSPVFISSAADVPVPIAPTDGEVAATTAQEAVASLDPSFPSSRYVLFARASESF